MKIEPLKFPDQNAISRIAVLNKYEKLYENKQFEVFGIHDVIKNQYKKLADLIYLAHALPARISDFYGDFVQGEYDKIRIEVKDNDTENNFIKDVVKSSKIKENILDWATDQSQFGFFTLLGFVVEGKYRVKAIPQDQCFPQSDGSYIFATFTKDPNASPDDKRLLCLTHNYELVNGQVQITRQAWRTNEMGVVMESFDYATLCSYLGQNLLEFETIKNLKRLPVVQVDNGRRMKYGFGKSDYADIMPQLGEINEKTTHVSTVIIKNLDAKMAVPESAVDPETHKLKSEEAYVVSKDDPKPEYVVNANSLIEETDSHIMRELKFLSFISCVPMNELLKGVMPERVEGMRINLFQAMRKAETKRTKLKVGIKEILEIGGEMIGKPITGEINVKLSDVLPTNELELVQAESEKVTAGISSKKSAMKRTEGYTDEEADAELQAINDENEIAGVNDGKLQL